MLCCTSVSCCGVSRTDSRTNSVFTNSSFLFILLFRKISIARGTYPPFLLISLSVFLCFRILISLLFSQSLLFVVAIPSISLVLLQCSKLNICTLHISLFCPSFVVSAVNIEFALNREQGVCTYSMFAFITIRSCNSSLLLFL